MGVPLGHYVEPDVLRLQRAATVHLRQSNALAHLFNAETAEQILAYLDTIRPPYTVFLQHTWDTFQVCVVVQCAANESPQLLVIASDAVYAG